MANNWLKVEHETPEKPEVFGIAAALQITPDEAFGILFRMWRWFDSHTEDGNARSVTPALLDRYLGKPGFAEACVSVGWLTFSAAGAALPNFDRHCGQTAKGRALTYNRVRQSRELKRSCNASNVTEALHIRIENKNKNKSKTESESKTENREQESGGKPPETPLCKRRVAYGSAFEEFWAAYPRKQAKEAAFKAYKRAGQRIKSATGKSSADVVAFLLERCRAYAAAKQDADLKFIPQAARWLNAGQYDDDPATWEREKGVNDGIAGNQAVLNKLMSDYADQDDTDEAKEGDAGDDQLHDA